MNRQRNPQSLAFLGLFFLAGEILLLFFKTKPYADHLVWFSALMMTIFFSLLIVYFTFREINDEKKHSDKKEMITAGRVANISQLLQEAQAMYREKIRHLERECEKIHEQYGSIEKQYETNLQEIQQKYKQLFEETSLYKIRCQSLHSSLDDALEELRLVRQECYLLKEKEHKNTQEPSGQFKQLREQFEEKSAVLDATRKDLFALEGQFISLQKQQELSMFEEEPQLKHLIEQLKKLEEENQILEKEILSLENLVGKLSIKKSPVRRRKKAGALELQFEEQKFQI